MTLPNILVTCRLPGWSSRLQSYTRYMSKGIQGNYWSLDSTGYDYRNGHVTVASITFLLWSGWEMSGGYPFLTHYWAIQRVPLSCTLSHNVWRSSCPPKSHNISRTAPTSKRATVNNGREICDWQWATKCDSDTGSPPVLPWYITELIYCHITLHMYLITRICYMYITTESTSENSGQPALGHCLPSNLHVKSCMKLWYLYHGVLLSYLPDLIDSDVSKRLIIDCKISTDPHHWAPLWWWSFPTASHGSERWTCSWSFLGTSE